MQSDVQLNRGYTLFGRRKGRKLRGQKPALVAELLPKLSIAKAETPLAPKELFPDASSLWLEIGFGGGEHLAAQAQRHPQTGMIGCEPFINGVANLLEIINANHIPNIRLYADDARDIIDRLPDQSVEKIFVLFPDPWPKKRHAERRFIGPANLPKLARILVPGGELRVASDEPLLQEWMEEHMRACPFLTPAPETLEGTHPARPAEWPFTRYEKKCLARKKYASWQGPRYYSFLKK